MSDRYTELLKKLLSDVDKARDREVVVSEMALQDLARTLDRQAEENKRLRDELNQLNLEGV